MSDTTVTKRIGIVGMCANFILLLLKMIVGVIFNSQALIADGINSLGDVFSSLLTYVGGKISSIPEDDEHEFGHGKAEFVASFLIGIFMIIVSIDMLYNSIKSVICVQYFEFSLILLITPIITILVKFMLYMYVKSVEEKYTSLLITAASSDHRNDILISLGVAIGIVLGKLGYPMFDGIIGGIISVVIAITGVKITYSAYDVLIDKCIDVEKVKEIKEYLMSIGQVRHIDSIKSKPTGNLHMLIIKISVDPEMTVNESHKIAGKIRSELREKTWIYDVIVHINPDS